MDYEIEGLAPDGKPVLNIEQKSDYAARNHKNPEHYKRYFDYLASMVKDFKILEFINKPGAGAEEYRRLRRTTKEIDVLGRWARKLAENHEGVIPKSLEWYPLPTFIFKNQGVNKDWLIDQEMRDVLVYALENTNVHPRDDKKCDKMNLEAKAEACRQRTVWAEFPEGATGMGRLELAPGCAIALPLCADPWLPRRGLPAGPDSTGKAATRLVPYDPTNSKHNRDLRGEMGVGIDARLFIEPEEGEANEPEKR